MIFYITAAILLPVSIYMVTLKWIRLWARIAFGVSMAFILLLLVLFGLEYKTNIKQAEASRRVVITALDVSASTGLKMDTITKAADETWENYNLEIIPFSNQVRGHNGAESTAMVDSVKNMLSYISGQYLEDEIAGFVLITDGNETEKISELKSEINNHGAYPHNIIYIPGKNKTIKFDKSVTFTRAPRFMPRFKKESITFAVSVTGAKLSGVPVELLLNGKTIGSVYVELDDGFGEGTFEFVIKKSGMFLLEAHVAVDSRETIKDNNTDFAIVEGIIKGFRVLHISGHPSSDTAFVRRGLQNIPGVDKISFFILRTHDKANVTPNSELSLIPFPTDQLFRTELDNFDVIIINDFDLKKFLNSTYINNISKFVLSGGGLLVFGGQESFIKSNTMLNSYVKVLPVVSTLNSNWINKNITMVPENISKLTSLREINPSKKIPFRGINKVAIKKWSNVFYRTAAGEPLITGGISGKGRVLAVLTDSFWRLSYNGEFSNESVLKSMVRYVLGIPAAPVQTSENVISFDTMYTSKDMKDLNAKLQFINFDQSIQKEETIKTGTSYELKNDDSRLINVKIEKSGTLIDEFSLVNYNEKTGNEYSYVSLGKEFLENFASTGGGRFITANKAEIESSLEKLKVREPIVITDKKEILQPIFMHKGILLILLYLVLSTFYLRSKYVE